MTQQEKRAYGIKARAILDSDVSFEQQIQELKR
ncbi:hypothetical protein WS105_0657 [Weissella ceti]|nr:hypothetical protein WS105_0657 [Weissella ceti]